MTGPGRGALTWRSSAPPVAAPGPSNSRTSRATRGLGAAAFSTFVALVSHVLAGGTVPGALGVAVPLVLATTACVALAGLRRSWLRLSVSVLLSQILFHTLFVLGTAGSTTIHLVENGGPHAGHGAQSALMVVSTTGSTGSMTHAAHGDAWMWLAHTLAGIVTIVALQRGEAVVRRLTRLSGWLVGALLPRAVRLVAVPAHPRSALSSDAGTWVPVPRPVVTTGAARRGPPALSTV